MVVAEAVVILLAVYALLGLLFAVAFVTCGVQRLDPAARPAPWGFRLLILPGSAALWPLLLLRWWGSTKGGASS
ncbi:MAG: hypothetical protein HY763_12045 [Planctomycetes bacterium]|nr:hypothetical protein [Planctomycetota bacterium]